MSMTSPPIQPQICPWPWPPLRAEAWQPCKLFVTACHHTGLVTSSMIRRSIIVEVEGGEDRARADTRTLLDYAGHHCPSEGGPSEGGPAETGSLSASNLSLTLNTVPSRCSAVLLTFGCCLYAYIALAAATLRVEGSISVHRKFPN